MSQRLLLVDADAYLHRAFHALSRTGLTNSKGQPTGALYGFARTLQKLLREQKPDHVAVCFDSPGPTFRHEAYADYKATRKETDEALRWQLPVARELAQAWGLHAVAKPGFEADDLIATLATAGAARGWEVLIVTGDKDAAQLVGGPVKILDEAKSVVLDAEGVKAKFGVRPEQIVDYLTLIGDASDNVPGVAGVGPSGAAKLLEAYGSLDAVFAAPAQDAGKLERAVRLVQSSRDAAERCRKLIVLEKSAPVDVSVDQLTAPEAPAPALMDVLRSLDFLTLIPELYPESSAAALLPDPGAADWSALKTGAPLSLALENGFLAVLCEGKAAVFELEGARSEELDKLGALMISDSAKSGHDLKTIYKALKARGLDLKPPYFDVMLAEYCLNPSKARYGIEDLALERLQAGLPAAGPERARAAALAVERLAAEQEPMLKEKELWDLYWNLELPLVPVLADMELAGIHVDRRALEALREEFSGRIAALEAELHAMAGSVVNLNSPKQLAALLFQKFGLPPQKKTKTGFSTDEEVLRALSPAHPFPAKLLDYRELAKLKSTYVDALLETADAQDRVHTQFLQTGAATGRLSSVAPNLQNIPIRAAEGRKVRRLFSAPPGHVLLSADYSQIDLRVLAHLSRDPALCEAFAAGEDVHARTAREMLPLEGGAVDAEARRVAKAINFGIVYGQTPHGLSQQLGIPMAEAQAYIEAYKKRYAGVTAWIERQLQLARREGSVRTLLGRVRYLPEINAKNAAVRGFAERVAVNTPIQGTSADIIKKAMLDVARGLKERGFKSRLLLQIHDELLFETPRAELDAVAAWARETMEAAVPLSVPLVVGVKAGADWQDLKELRVPALEPAP